MKTYITEQKEMTKDFFNENECLYVWKEPDITYDWAESNERNHTKNITISAKMLGNQSVWAHVFFTMDGYASDPRSSIFHPKVHPYATLMHDICQAGHFPLC